ncbi:exopolysaccharide biosynthesis protein [Hydrogenophaga sp. A37]|uniref:exopolysaccharide biosynthesis protein n=1 Tax=Hydrogenophaga sp. A37 TaxID=1945864 RepID=UPI000985F76A|nr:exopolysaccharide biosynthesis protein [Hydrogenophaga sp. A37]OOG81678.1 hypothetical protein B0E41_17160 [Hydrogenophaga sp. A37]
MIKARAQQLRRAAGEPGTACERLSLNQLLRLNGEGSGAVLLMLLALLSSLPVAGAGGLFSIGLLALAWAWLRGRETVTMPQRLGSITLSETWSRRSLHGMAWIYEQAERRLRPRWPVCCHARTRVWWGLWIALMAVVIFLPLPLGNVLPSLSLILLSLGWMFRDGVAMLLSAATGVGALGYVVSLGHLLTGLLVKAWAWWPY